DAAVAHQVHHLIDLSALGEQVGTGGAGDGHVVDGEVFVVGPKLLDPVLVAGRAVRLVGIRSREAVAQGGDREAGGHQGAVFERFDHQPSAARVGDRLSNPAGPD